MSRMRRPPACWPAVLTATWTRFVARFATPGRGRPPRRQQPGPDPDTGGIELYLRRRMAGRRHTWSAGPPLTLWRHTMSTAIRDTWRPGDPDGIYPYPRIELLVVDEADRL